ncbi:hypothetical protein [Streptomyces tropicalis]|uniref:Transposase n=1 Tax=Streptomyces tropicalis TaxID=3034234 RepID=A0ABT6AEW6_9ACTN|nr:hypothetical protein [Streptomyces tropicalis]MDF3303194.1 hypothetical protein [Streptomyces tropicalis]
MTRTKRVDNQRSRTADGHLSVYAPLTLLIGRSLHGEEVWATIQRADDQLLGAHGCVNEQHES